MSKIVGSSWTGGLRRLVTPGAGQAWCGPICLLLVVAGLGAQSLRGASPQDRREALDGVYEASGITQASNGSVVVIEDEPSRPFWVVTPAPDGAGLSAEALRPSTPLDALAGSVNDLEGITAGDGGFVYAITSHSRQRNGKRDRSREKLVRFKVRGARMEAVGVRTDLRTNLVRAFPELEESADERKVKRKSGLNIEGLAFDPLHERLWIGLRAPLVDDQALLIALVNPEGAFERDEPLRFAGAPVLLDLDGGGIRDVTYSPRLGGYLILSQLDADKEKHFKLWLWNGVASASPRRVRIKGVDHLDRAEGVASLTLNGEEKVVIVNDDGKPGRGRGASFLLVDYRDLRIEEES